MKRIKSLAALGLAMALFAPVLKAAGQEGPCRADMEKFCKDSTGKDRMACMKQHEADLSDACKAKRAEMKEKNAAKHPCMADGEKLCSGMRPGDGKFMSCMKQHESELSEGCKAKMAEMKEKNAAKHPCMADGEKLCPGMHPGDGKFMPCMKQHEAEVSDACKAKMAEKKHERQEKRQGQGAGQTGK